MPSTLSEFTETIIQYYFCGFDWRGLWKQMLS